MGKLALCSAKAKLLALALLAVAAATAVAVVVAGSRTDQPSSPPPAPPKCGGAVNTGAANCEPQLWVPTGTSNASMACYAYGGPSDPCALTVTNDADAGRTKDPSGCAADTFFLWDEPETQGETYEWAASRWLVYAASFAAQIGALRARGVRFTTPMLKADNASGRLLRFWSACGAPCSNESSPAYIDIVAVNPFCGVWNLPVGTAAACRNGAAFVLNDLRPVLRGRAVYVTNWGYLGSSTAAAQLAAMDATDAFFVDGSPVARVYWFGATDYGGGTTNNFLDRTVESGDRAGQTLGAIWKAKCDSL
ncbi:hypothetical protein AB1Y20_005014 [Prymnesium parvum]|uniref:Chitinase n=1 Tax=Prymnesium parvum TaxID=97485 RepID=A0AB34J3G1_PRYPA